MSSKVLTSFNIVVMTSFVFKDNYGMSVCLLFLHIILTKRDTVRVIQ